MSRESIINNSKVMIGRNEYSMNINKRVCALTPYSDGKYYSDCSSFASACFMAGGHDVGWNNTSSFCTNNLFYTVPITQSGQNIVNPDKVLKPADVIVWPGHCCIVERIDNGAVYVMDHGSGNPKILALSSVCSWNYGNIVVRRLKELESEEDSELIIEEAPPTTEEKDNSPMYKVQAGAYSAEETARGLSEELGSHGFESYVFIKDGKYTIQCGAFRDQVNASNLADKLRSKGFDAYVYEEK